MFRPLSETKFINDANLVSYWKLDETSGTTAVDSKGSNNGTWTNFAYGAGKYGNAGSFNGSSSKIVASWPALPTDLTVSFYVKTWNTNRYGIVWWYKDAANRWVIEQYPANKITYRYSWGSWNRRDFESTNAVLSTSNFVHIVVTQTWTNNPIMYVNWVVSPSSLSYQSWTNIKPTWTNIWIWRDELLTNYLNWLIDDVAIFNRALTYTEVLELYEWISYWELVATANTKLLLHLNGNSTDASGNGNNGTDINITYVNGVFGQGASFNGSSSRINIPDSTSLNMTTNFTVSMRVNTNTLTSAPVLAIKWWYQINWWYCEIQSAWSFALITNVSWWYTAVMSTTWLITNGSRTHLTFVKSWTSWYLYKNWTIVPLSTNNSLNISASSNPLYLWTYNWTQSRLDGRLDEVIIQDRAWSATEVLNYYNQSKGVYAPKMI